jgi:BirA family biotin operon repressor/biotin-[acetyl-CoA-carboxylase] ligase
VIDEPLHAMIEQLCADGSIERIDNADTETSLLTALNTLGIFYRKSDRRLEIESPRPLINQESIQSQLGKSALLDGFEWQYQLLTESTNADALRLFECGRKPCIAIAEMQSDGRGRRGRQWLSPFAKNIICTVGLPKSIEGCNPGLLSIVTGLALVDALAKSAIDGVELKWPNDLYYQTRKLGGILIESKMIADQAYFFAIGFGINVMMDTEDLSTIPQPVTSIDLIADNPISRDRILTEAIRHVVKAINDFDRSSVSEIVDRFQANDAFKNQAIRVKYGDELIDGLNLGINSEGQLKLQSGQGVREFSAADISIRGNP